MPRKESITKQYLIDTAFLMAKQEGIENVTARKLASRAGCSTQPIFRLYENMEDLWKEIYDKSVEFFAFYNERSKNVAEEPFVNLGYAYIRFAAEETNLFKMLFLSDLNYGKSMYEVLNGKSGLVQAEMAKAKMAGVANSGELFTKMWIFVHGAACMTTTGDYDLGADETVTLLKSTYRSFM